MTADAKIGLLLALIFIVAIAFVINGLGFFNEWRQGPEPQRDYISKYNPREPGLLANTDKVARALNRTTISLKQITPPAKESESSVRYQAFLPKANKVVEKSATDPKPLEKTFIKILPKTIGADIKIKKYTVQDGDNLAGIAKKFYGQEAGNTLANIEKIFKANRNILKSQDELHIDQQLIIPPLGAKNRTTTLPGSLADSSTGTTKFREHIVRQDDSLWEIAAKYLGNGNRYKEIIKLNSSIEDEHTLAVGMRLRLPKR